MSEKQEQKETALLSPDDYRMFIDGIKELLEKARRTAARSVNALMTATYWEIGRRIVEFEQGGKMRAGYGKALLKNLSRDLTARFGRGFSPDNLERFRLFYSKFPPEMISATLSRKCVSDNSDANKQTKSVTLSRNSADNLTEGKDSTVSSELTSLTLADLAMAFPLPWSHYVLLIRRAHSPESMNFYLAEALRGGWSVRQLQRQIDSQFYERTCLSHDKAAMLQQGQETLATDVVTADEEIKDPLVLEFLGLKDEYSESDLEDALIHHLETFLLELGSDFAFMGRQRRLRIDDEWYRVDLLFFHRRLRCLVIIDLKLGRFTHADAGQMHLYLNYARENWTHDDENPPVGIILCAAKGEALVRYATEGLPNKMVVREYLTTLPDEKLLAAEIDRTRKVLESRREM